MLDGVDVQDDDGLNTRDGYRENRLAVWLTHGGVRIFSFSGDMLTNARALSAGTVHEPGGIYSLSTHHQHCRQWLPWELGFGVHLSSTML